MLKKATFFVAAAAMLAAGNAWAQPRIVSLGSNAVGTGVLNGGATVVGNAGGTAARWTIDGSSVSLLPLTGSASATAISTDGQYVIGVLTNTGGLGGLPADATLAARWSEANGWTPLALVSADATLGVTGAGASSGSISAPRAISGSGRFVVGQGYIAPNNSFRFRGWFWDADANGGAGESRVLSTAFNAQNNRFRDGRALAVSADGAVIVGGEDPNSSGGRLLVYRWNETTSVYDAAYLPDGVDGSGNPITRNVDNFFINDAGTIIVGLSPVFDSTTGFATNYLTKWTWDAKAGEWAREPLSSSLTTPASWWNPGSCDIPPSFIPTGMSEDGNTIVGIAVYSTCGSFVRGGFIWNGADSEMLDLYDVLVAAGTPGITDFGPVGENLPPRLGWANDISPDGLSLTGYGGPQSGFGPGWVVTLEGGDCVQPFITGSPSNVLISRCGSFIMNAGAGGSGPLSYQWQKDNEPLPDGPTASGSVVTGATTSQLRIAGMNPADAGSYHCVITGPCGKPVATAAATAVVDPALPTLTNDTCATAMPVNEGTFSFNPCGAFIDDTLIPTCALNTASDVWYLYTPTFTGAARIETCGATYDTVVSVFSACDGFEIACNDDRTEGTFTGCSSTRSRISSFQVIENEPVLVRVAALGSLFSTASGQVTILQAPAPVVNDICALAIPAIVGVNNYNTDEATSDTIVSCNSATTARDVWYTFTSTTGGTLRLTTCGTSWNTVLTVFDNCGGIELACNDNSGASGCSSQSIIDNFAVEPNVFYYIRVGANSNTTSGGAGVLNVEFEATCTADFNDDDAVNSQDFFDFLNAFFKVEPAADFNNDGAINSQDFFDFLNIFFVGC